MGRKGVGGLLRAVRGVVVAVVAAVALGAGARPALAQWDPGAANRPIPPFRIAGNLYYVGAVDIAAYLITTPEGHIVIDGGLPETAPMILEGIRTLGYRPEDVRILLNSHAHFDHAGGLAALKDATGARVWIHERDADQVERGGLGDPVLGDTGPFPAVGVDERFRDGAVVRLGGMELTAHLTAGHTRGCTSWSFAVEDGGRRLDAVIVCSVTVLPGVRLAGEPSWPGIADDYAASFRRLEGLPVDLFLASHGTFFGLEAKAEALRGGAAPNPFIDPERYRRYLERGRRAFEERLTAERGGG